LRHEELLDCLTTELGGGVPMRAPTELNTPGLRFGATGDKARILLVDDNLTNQEVALGILRRWGLAVDAAADGQEALQALAGTVYDLVLMDARMPVMDGFEATRVIRDPESRVLNHRIPVIAMTADAMGRDRDRCRQAGMDDYLSKPVEPRALAEAIARWLPPRRIGSEPLPATHQPTPPDMAVAGLVFNREAFLCRMLDDEAILLSIQEGFLEDMPGQIGILQEMVTQGLVERIGNQAHKIKGAAANVGGEAMSAAADALEEAVAKGNQQQLEERMSRLRNEFDRLKRAMGAPTPFTKTASDDSLGGETKPCAF
jgi:CheY-like chemotaxis protein/HPt (histidine-containing phosphotransfer) domain-containing protein